MTIAQAIRKIIVDKCPATFSLYAGCGVAAGNYVHFPVGAQLRELRNESGRCVFAHYRYADGSELIYRYSEKKENYSLTASV